jgi:hypothetical protein
MSDPAPPPTVPDINDRCCAFCASDRAWFAYGPPLTRTTFWVCRAHQPDAEACAIAGTIPPLSARR